MSNYQLTVNVIDRIMSTSIILLDQNSNANDVDIMVFEPCVLFSPCGCLGGGIEHMVQSIFLIVISTIIFHLATLNKKLNFIGSLRQNFKLTKLDPNLKITRLLKNRKRWV